MRNRISFDWTQAAIVAIVAILLVGGIWVIYEDEKAWAQFSAEHNCRKVGEIKGGTSTGLAYGMTASGKFVTGVVTTTDPDKIGWLCDDGVTYWR